MSALLDALLGANRAEVEMNPWLNAAKGAASTDLSGYDMNPWTRALMQIGQGFGSGMMAGYGKKQVEEAQQNRASQIVDIMKNTTGKPLVDALQDVPGIKPYIGAIAIEQAANDAANRKELNKFLLEKQGMMLGDDNQVIQLFDPNAREIALAGGKKAAELAAERKAFGGIPFSPKEVADKEIDLANKIASSPEARAFGDVEANFKAIEGLANQKTQAASVGIITAVAKILDPGAVVRESDFQVIADPGSPARGLQSYLSKIQGEGALKPEMKQDLINMAKEAVKARYGNYKNFADPLLFTAEKQGVNRNNIQLRPAPDLSFELPDAILAAAQAEKVRRQQSNQQSDTLLNRWLGMGR